jgi:phage terminase large subunit-like protein
MDGLNAHFVNLDELHAYHSRGVIDVLETATGARRQPLVFKITTAGDDPVSPCGDEHAYACSILEGTLHDDTYFAFIAHADPEDDWTTDATARKANPNYGVSVNPDDLLCKRTPRMDARHGEADRPRRSTLLSRAMTTRAHSQASQCRTSRVTSGVTFHV